MARLAMTSMPDLHRRAVAEFDRRVAAVPDDRWSSPTPCTEWDVRALVNHLVYEDLWAKELLEGRTLEEVGGRFDGDNLGDDPQAAWASARDGALAAVAATPSEAMVHTSMGRIDRDEYLGQVFADHLIHAWDLARGSGGDERLDPELVAVALGMLEPMEPMLRASGAFGDLVEVPPDADPQDRLLGLVGREPA